MVIFITSCSGPPFGPPQLDGIRYGPTCMVVRRNRIIIYVQCETDTKTGRGRHASACQISSSYNASFRRSLETEKINRLSIIM